MSDPKEKKQTVDKEKIKQTSKEVVAYYLKEPYVPFGLFILLSIALNAIIPLGGLFPGFVQLYVGLAFLVLAMAIMKWAFKHMRLNGETWSPLHIESRVLIVFGPYHYTRNPMFLSMTIIYIALFLFLNNLWGLILLFPMIMVLSKYVIAPREELFREMYGEVYEDYHNKTGRWL
jgi:protein-S-isoprenylcysteine O-methyltransferase Ste14